MECMGNIVRPMHGVWDVTKSRRDHSLRDGLVSQFAQLQNLCTSHALCCHCGYGLCLRQSNTAGIQNTTQITQFTSPMLCSIELWHARHTTNSVMHRPRGTIRKSIEPALSRGVTSHLKIILDNRRFFNRLAPVQHMKLCDFSPRLDSLFTISAAALYLVTTSADFRSSSLRSSSPSSAIDEFWRLSGFLPKMSCKDGRWWSLSERRKMLAHRRRAEVQQQDRYGDLKISP